MSKEPLPPVGKRRPPPKGNTRPSLEETAPALEGLSRPSVKGKRSQAAVEDDVADFLLNMEEEEAVEEAPPPAPKKPAPNKPAPARRPAPAAAARPAAPTRTPQAPAKATQPPQGGGRTAVAGNKAAAAPSGGKTTQVPANSKATVLGDYRLLKKLGQGGMGAVYKAHQISLDREVALKVLNKELASKPAFVQRFLREARVMARLDHPNILRSYGVGDAGGFHFLAMEYVDGGSVEGWLKKLGRFSVEDALLLIQCVCKGLQHAHEGGMVHRDIKPDNILLTRKGQVKVADLGLAKANDEDMNLTKTGTGAGTPIYMAPEQARDVKHVDGRVDIYALGVMLYVLLAGEAPFKGETLVDLITAKEKGKYVPVRRLNPEVPERLDLIVGKMIAPRPEHRYSDCASILADLEALGLAGERLGFLEDAAPVDKSAAATIAPRSGQKTSTPAAPRKKTMLASADSVAALEKSLPPREALDEYWYWKFTNDDGREILKKLTKDQVNTLIKSGSLDAQAQISRSRSEGFRSLGSFADFGSLFKGVQVKSKADRKGEKFRQMYQTIEKEEQSRRRWRWVHNLFLKTGGFVGFLLWMAIVAGVVVGGYFGVRWLIEFIGKKMQASGAL